MADPTDPKVLYTFDTATGKLLASTDKGLTFAARATGLPSGDGGYQLAAAPGRSGDLWLSTKGNGLFRSTDGGKSFTKITSCQASYTLGFGAAADGASFLSVYQVATVGGVTGVYRSDDAAKTWLRINDDEHQWAWIGQAITGDPRVYGQVYLATNGRGIQFGQPA